MYPRHTAATTPPVKMSSVADPATMPNTAAVDRPFNEDTGGVDGGGVDGGGVDGGGVDGGGGVGGGGGGVD
eukprot:scaffold22191_cov128-Isochrysis_galbana.AAC.1